MDFVRDATTNDETQSAPAIFGLRYLEEDEAEIYDVVGCAVPVTSPNGYAKCHYFTTCDDEDVAV
jgi:hypothetical protein